MHPHVWVKKCSNPHHFDACLGFGNMLQSYALWWNFTPRIIFLIVGLTIKVKSSCMQYFSYKFDHGGCFMISLIKRAVPWFWLIIVLDCKSWDLLQVVLLLHHDHKDCFSIALINGLSRNTLLCGWAVLHLCLFNRLCCDNEFLCNLLECGHYLGNLKNSIGWDTSTWCSVGLMIESCANICLDKDWLILPLPKFLSV